MCPVGRLGCDKDDEIMEIAGVVVGMAGVVCRVFWVRGWFMAISWSDLAWVSVGPSW